MMKPKTPILVVEDEGIVALDITRQLTKLGYDPVDVVATAEDAVERATALRPHLVLMDIHLAGRMDGVEAAIIIRERLSIPSVFLTAYATDDVVERAKRADPLGYVIKPFDEFSLRTSIEIALHKDQSDRRVRESQARYVAIEGASTDAIVTINNQGEIIGFSRAAEAMFGYTEDAVKGRPSACLLREPHGILDAAEMARLMWSTETPLSLGGGDLRARRSDGREFPIERSLARWETADGWFMTAFVRDITDRVQFERSLWLQAAALRAAANAIVITDRAGAIEWVNPAFSALTGFSSAEAMGQNPRDLVKSGRQDHGFYAKMWDAIVAGQVWEGELTNRRKDGSLYQEWQTITPVVDAAGEITHFVGVKRDLTSEQRLQEQFLQAQKMEVVGQLAGGIAHDFNNLLTVINGESDMAREGLAPDDPMRATLGYILDAGERAARLTSQLLMFSRKQIASPSVLSVGAEVHAFAPMIRRLIGEDIVLSIDVDDHSGTDNVLIDRGQLEQVLLNLAVNSRDAMAGLGGGLTIRVRPSAQDVMIAVTDTGCGIPPEIRARLFEPFFTTKPQGKGTGLGLATVCAIVTQNSGRLEVESEVGHGATFKIFLPASAVLSAADVAPESVARGNETILLVEDEPDIRELTARMLRSAGYAVFPMESGSAALGWFKGTGQHVDLLLTDVVMPGLTGPELAAAVAVIRPDLPVLFMSGYADDKLTAEVLRIPERFIAKPYQTGALAAKVRRILDGRPVG